MTLSTFTAGQVLTATALNNVHKQCVITCTSTTRPSSPPEGMTIYETDTDRMLVYTTGPGWVPPWNKPWGVVPTTSGGTSGYGYCRITTSQGTFTSATDITNATVTFTAVANRLYRITAHVDITSSVTGDGAQVQILIDGTAYATDIVAVNVAGTGLDRFVKLNLPITLTSGSHTVKLQAQRVSGTGNLTIQGATASPTVLIVEDAGPAGAPA